MQSPLPEMSIDTPLGIDVIVEGLRPAIKKSPQYNQKGLWIFTLLNGLTHAELMFFPPANLKRVFDGLPERIDLPQEAILHCVNQTGTDSHQQAILILESLDTHHLAVVEFVAKD